MRATWAWASAAVLAVGLFPASALARESGRDRERGERERGRAEERHPGGGDRRSRGGEHRAEREDRGSRARSDRPPARESARAQEPGTFRWPSGRDSRDRHDDRQWRRSGVAPYRGYPSSRGYRPAPRYPAYHPYGYYHRRGYYYPRYEYDYDRYPTHASIRILVEPAEAEVYVDGYYAGVADDFDGFFQRLDLAPGRHEITLRLDGYETWSADVFAAPDTTLKLHHDMLPGASRSEFRAAPDPNEPGPYEPQNENEGGRY